MRLALLCAALLLPSVALAQYPPPKNAQDAACRREAERRVFSGRNPQGVSLETIGRRYWNECMSRSSRSKASKSKQRTASRKRR